MSELSPSDDSSVAKHICRVIFAHAARISRESDISQLLQLNADLARDLTGADRCSVWLLDGKTGELWTKIAHGVKDLRIAAGTGLIGTCIRENRAVIVNETGTDDRFLRKVDQASGYRTNSVLAVPLHTDGRVIGAIQVLNKPGGFQQADSELLNLVAAYAAAEIESERLRQEAESARLVMRELELAYEVQTNLLPKKLNQVKGLEYAGFSRPAKSVGGDYYDFLELPDGLFSFTLGDVSGKGMPAAVLMASIQTLLRSHLLRQARPLSTLVSEVSHTVYLCSSMDRYSTLFCGLFDSERRKLTYVNAGHPAPMILRGGAEGKLERAAGGDIPIGLLPNIGYHEHSIHVNPGDLVVCISDGIAEVLNHAGSMWDESEVESVVLQHRDHSAKELIDAMVRRVEEYAEGSEQYDDMTIAVLRIAG